MKRLLGRFFLVIFCWSSLIMAEIDNRFIPVYDFPYQHQPCRRSDLLANLFVAMGDEGYIDMKGHVPFPELFGKYDMSQAAEALVYVGKTNPMPSPWQTVAGLNWDMVGKLHAQGLWVSYEPYLGKNLSVGFRVPFMHMSSQMEFLITDEVRQSLGLGAGGDINAFQVLNQVNRELGFPTYQWKQTGFGDLDLYLRWGTVQDYVHKLKRLDASIRVGALLPINGEVDLDTPMALTFCGYGHKAFYFQVDVNCELKDDWRAGFWFNTTQRLIKTQLRRMSAWKELPQFGAIVGEAEVDPGVTVGFAPYIWVDDIRNGLGLRGSLRFIWHTQDFWRDQRVNQNGVAAQLADVIKTSSWESEYVTIGLVYDLQQASGGSRIAPYFYLDLDVPTRVFGADRVAKTYRLTGGFEFNF